MVARVGGLIPASFRTISRVRPASYGALSPYRWTYLARPYVDARRDRRPHRAGSRRGCHITHTANLIIAATVITALVIWDLAGHLPLPLGVAGHEGSTVIVGLNGLRLLRNAAWQKAAGQLPT